MYMGNIVGALGVLGVGGLGWGEGPGFENF